MIAFCRNNQHSEGLQVKTFAAFVLPSLNPLDAFLVTSALEPLTLESLYWYGYGSHAGILLSSLKQILTLGNLSLYT